MLYFGTVKTPGKHIYYQSSRFSRYFIFRKLKFKKRLGSCKRLYWNTMENFTTKKTWWLCYCYWQNNKCKRFCKWMLQIFKLQNLMGWQRGIWRRSKHLLQISQAWTLTHIKHDNCSLQSLAGTSHNTSRNVKRWSPWTCWAPNTCFSMTLNAV